MTPLLAFLPPPDLITHWGDFVGDWVGIVSDMIGLYAELLAVAIVAALLRSTGKAADDAE